MHNPKSAADQERAAAAWEAKLAEEEAIARALGKAAKPIEQAVQAIEAAAGSRRTDVLRAVARIFDLAALDAGAGKANRIAEQMCALASEYKASVDQARNPRPSIEGTPLVRDTAIYAKRGFEYRDAGDAAIAKVGVNAGAISLVPDVVAKAAATAGLVDILQTPKGRRLRALDRIPVPGNERSGWPRGSQRMFEEPFASQLLAQGLAEEIEELLPDELKSYRVGHPELPVGGHLDLGTFNSPGQTNRDAA